MRIRKRTGAEGNVIYGGQINIYLSDVFCFDGHILYLHSSYTESVRG